MLWFQRTRHQEPFTKTQGLQKVLEVTEGPWLLGKPRLLEAAAAGISEDELREVMPVCVLKDVRKRYPNPDGIPYMGHKRF